MVLQPHLQDVDFLFVYVVCFNAFEGVALVQVI